MFHCPKCGAPYLFRVQKETHEAVCSEKRLTLREQQVQEFHLQVAKRLQAELEMDKVDRRLGRAS